MIIELTSDQVERSRIFGINVVEGYYEGKKERSKGFRVPSKPSIWDNPLVQAQGRLCEIGCCSWLGLDDRSALDWQTNHCDPLVDFRHNGFTVDVKGSGHERAKFLIWPVTKLEHMEQMADRLILARTGLKQLLNKVEIVGWTTKETFLASYKTAALPVPLVAGTPYLTALDLMTPESWS